MAYGEYEPILDADGNSVMLGKGSFGKVYLVQKTKLGRRYALKLLGNEHLDKKSSARNRFLREVETFAGLHHPNIVNIADYGECEEGIYYVMDYCEGGSLETLVRNLRPFSVPLVLRLLDKSAAALEYAHAKGLIHRDIKPENLMLLSNTERDDDLPDLIRLIDFGLAKDLSVSEDPEPGVSLTQESQVVGTPLYMSPEQLSGSVVDHRADIFSLGITAWYLLAGTQAFAHLHNGSLIRQDRFSAPAYKSKLPDRLTGQARDVIARMIEKEEGRRFQDYRSLREALKAALDDEHHSSLSIPLEYRSDPGPPPPQPAAPQLNGNDYHYTGLTVHGPDPATGGTLLSALCGGLAVQLITAPGHLAPALSQMLGRLDVPERPASIIHYHRHTFSSNHPGFPGSCLCTAQPPSGPDLLSILRHRKRTTLEEAKSLLQQIAEAMDFARPREISLRFAPGDIILPHLGPNPDTAELSTAEVRLYPTILVRSDADKNATLSATIAQNGSSTGAGVPTHRDFAALIYRILAGREVDAGAFHAARKYTGISSLQAKADSIIRDTISGTHHAQSCRALLLNLCSSEGIRLPDRVRPATEAVIPPMVQAPPPLPRTEPFITPPVPPAPPVHHPTQPTQPTTPMGRSIASTMDGSMIHDELLIEPPLWRNLPNAVRRQLISCLRDTWELRGDIDRDHTQATRYSTQSQTQIQQFGHALKEAEEAARDIESCRRTLQDCYSQATLALHQIRDSTDPTLAEIRKKDIYGLLEIAEHARQDADNHFDLLGKLGPRREALLQQAEAIEEQAKALLAKTGQTLPEIPIIFLDDTTRSQCAEVEREIRDIAGLAASATPVAAATAADSLYGIENILQEAKSSLTEATTRWQRISPSITHLSDKLTHLKDSIRDLETNRQRTLSDIKALQSSARFSAESANRFEREIATLIERHQATLPRINTLAESAAVTLAAREASDAVRRLDDILGETARETSPDRIRGLLTEANSAKDTATDAVRRASTAHRDFTAAVTELEEKARNHSGHLATARQKAAHDLSLLGTHRQNAEAAAKRAAEIAAEHPAAQAAALRAQDLTLTLQSLHSAAETAHHQAQNTEELEVAEAAAKRTHEAVEKAAEAASRAQTALEEAQRQLQDRTARLQEARQTAVTATSQAQTAATQIEALLEKAAAENHQLPEADRTPAALAPLEAAARTARHAATLAGAASATAAAAHTPDPAEAAATEATRAAAEAASLLTKAQQDYTALAVTFAGTRAAWSQVRLDFSASLTRIRELLAQTTTFRQTLLTPTPGTTPLTTAETSALHLLQSLPAQLDTLQQTFDRAPALAEAAHLAQQASALATETAAATTLAQAAHQQFLQQQQQNQQLLAAQEQQARDLLATQQRESKLLATQAAAAAREAKRDASRIARHPKAGDARPRALALATEAQNHADHVLALAAAPLTATTLADLKTHTAAAQTAATTLTALQAALPANPVFILKWAAAALGLLLCGSLALEHYMHPEGHHEEEDNPKKEGVVSLKLPATLAFGTITEKGKPKVDLEASFLFTLGDKTSNPIPVSSNSTTPLNLSEAERSSGTTLFVKISAPGYQDSQLFPISPGTQESFRIPPIELLSEAPVPKLPETLSFAKLLPESGVTLALGSSSVPIFPGKTIPLSAFGQFDPTKPLILTASAPGYDSASITLEPGDKTAQPPLPLEPTLATFTWKSDPPDWFNAARLVRLDPPKDDRISPDLEINTASKKIPVGRYRLSGIWGKIQLPLDEVTLTSGPSETTLKWPIPTKTQWTGIMNLNPQSVLSGPTGPLKQVAASWEILIPAPVFLQLQSNGSASIRITNSQIMQLSAFGLLAGSIGPKDISDPYQISKVFRESVIKPLTNETASGSSLGIWFGNFWQAQSVTKLTKSEEWRTSLFMQSQNQVSFLNGILTSKDPFSYFSTSEHQTPLNNFFDNISLQAESLEGEELKFTSTDKSLTVLLKLDGRSAKLNGPQRTNVILKPR